MTILLIVDQTNQILGSGEVESPSELFSTGDGDAEQRNSKERVVKNAVLDDEHQVLPDTLVVSSSVARSSEDSSLSEDHHSIIVDSISTDELESATQLEVHQEISQNHLVTTDRPTAPSRKSYQVQCHE